MPDLPHPTVLAAVWHQLRCLRDFHHHPLPCPTGMAAATRMLHGGNVPHGCTSCYDVLVDALLHLRAVAGPDPTVPLARVVVRRHVVDRLRTANTDLHGVARPERRDGVPGRIRTALANHPDGAWLDTLLTLVLRAASARTPVPREVWPFDAFATARARALPDTPHDEHPRRVRTDVTTVLHTIRAVAGQSWFDDHVAAAVRARHARYATPVPDDDPAAPERDDPDRDTLLHALTRHRDHDPATALRHALTDLRATPVDPTSHLDGLTALFDDLAAVGLAPPADTPGRRRAS